MITQYDMHNIEVIEQRNGETREERDECFRNAEQLRLMSVHEATTTEQRIAAAAPAVIMIPIDLLIGR